MTLPISIYRSRFSFIFCINFFGYIKNDLFFVLSSPFFFFFFLVSEVGVEWGSGELQFSLTPETCGSSFESTFGI